MASWCTDAGDVLRLTLHIMPNAKHTGPAGLHGDALKLRLQAPPVDGKANDALVRYLAARLNVPRSAIAISHGHTARRKQIEIRSSGLSAAEAERRLLGSDEG